MVRETEKQGFLFVCCVPPGQLTVIDKFQKEVLEKSPVDEMSVEFVMGQFVRTEVSNC